MVKRWICRPLRINNRGRIKQIACSVLAASVEVLVQTVSIQVSSSHTQVIVSYLNEILGGIYVAVDVEALTL